MRACAIVAGMASRFETIYFDDFNPVELESIWKHLCKEKGYSVGDDVSAVVRRRRTKWSAGRCSPPNSGVNLPGASASGDDVHGAPASIRRGVFGADVYGARASVRRGVFGADAP